jgi:hypothetical protein
MTKLLCSLGLVAALSISSGRAAVIVCAPPPAGLAGWWPGDGNATDLAGASAGALENGVSFAPGLVERAFRFNGTNGGVDLGNAAAFDFGPDSSFTIEAWFDSFGPTPPPNDGQIIVALNDLCGDSAPAQVLALCREPGANTTRLCFNVRDVNGLQATVESPEPPRNAFHHVAAVREVNGTNKTLRLFVDGALVGSAPDPTTGSLAAAVPDTIGRRNVCGTENVFNGLIDEVSIYQRALAPAEILAIFQAGGAGKCKPRPLLVGVQGHGTVSKAPDKALYAFGETVTLTATAGRYARFLAWNDGVTNHQRTVTVGVTNRFVAIFTNLVPVETLVFKQWERSYGGTNYESNPVIRRTRDGGFVLAGATTSGLSGNKMTPLCGESAAWVLKLDSEGNVEWEQTIGVPEGGLFIVAIEQTSDGGYVLGTSTEADISPVSNNCGKTSPAFGDLDFWLVRLDALGQRLWDASFGGSCDDELLALQQTSDGGFVLAGDSQSGISGNKTSPNFGLRDYWVVRVDANGNRLWDRSLGGTETETAWGVVATPEGGFIVGGVSLSGPDGNKTAPALGEGDIWVVCLDAQGNRVWDRSYGGTKVDVLVDLVATAEGDAFLGGYSRSGRSGTKTSPNFGRQDYWVVRIDADGDAVWDRSFGGSEVDLGFAVKPTADGGVLVCGESFSDDDGNKDLASFGSSDGWAVRLDAAGNKLWEYALGGTDLEYTFSAELASDGGLVLASGSASDPSGNKTSAHWGDEDFWLVKLAERAAPVGTPVILINGQFYPSNSVVVTNFAKITIQTSLTNGIIFYTLDGSDPRGGALYVEPFAVAGRVIVRAIAFGEGFAQGVEADPLEILVLGPPLIVLQPQSQQVLVGDDVILTVEATGTQPLFYQWRFNGLEIEGANGATLQLTNLQVADTGLYDVVVANEFGAAISDKASLVVLQPPTIVQPPPPPTNVIIGASLMLCAEVEGSGPFQYQWRRNGVSIPEATDSCIFISRSELSDGGHYSVLIENAAGSLLSESAQVLIAVPPTAPGDNFADRVPIVGAFGAVSGTNLFATKEPGEPNPAGKFGGKSVWYTWQAPDSGIVTFRTVGSTFDTLLGMYSGTTVSDLTPRVSDEDGGGFLTSEIRFYVESNQVYQIAIDGAGGQAGTFILTWDLELTSERLPAITGQPIGGSVALGATFTFTVEARASGEGPLRYQWYFQGNVIQGATEPSFTVTNVLAEQVGAYNVRVSEGPRFVDSALAVLEIGPANTPLSFDKVGDLLQAAAFGEGGPPAAPRGARAPAPGTSVFVPVTAGTTGERFLNNSTNYSGPIEVPPCGARAGASVYYGVKATADGYLVIDTIGSTIDTALAIYEVKQAYTDEFSFWADAPNHLVTCDDDGAPDGVRSLVCFRAKAGTNYLIQIDGAKTADRGSIKLNYRYVAPAPLFPSDSLQLMGVGSSVLLSALTTNAPAGARFQWLTNGVALRGATNATLCLIDMQYRQGGTYSVNYRLGTRLTNFVVARLVMGQLDYEFSRASGHWELNMTARASQASALEASAELSSWTPVITQASPNTPFNYADTQLEQPQRTYRLRPLP